MIVKRVAMSETEPETVADLLTRLGGVPPGRVRMKPDVGTATAADLAANPGPLCELIDGVLVEKAMGDRESMLGLWVARLVGNLVDADDLGIVLGADGFIRFSDTLIRAPDATFIPWANLPADGLPKEAYWSVTPGLIVEVLSPHNTPGEIDRKLREFFGIKCKLAWVIDPEAKTARVHTSAAKFKLLDETGTLDGGRVLPGFALPLADLFAVGRRRHKRR